MLLPISVLKLTQVLIIGAGTSGLCAGYELKKAGFDIQIFEASSRVGGRVKTFKDPFLAPGLHGEGGAMRIPDDHFLTLEYVKQFGLEGDLFPFEQENKFIFLENYGSTLTYDKFNELLKAKDPKLLALFPGLADKEQGKTCDELFDEAVQQVKDDFEVVYKDNPDNITAAYKAITEKYDRYSLRSYLTDVAGWSQAAINLYDVGNAHVVFENGFIESWKDAFLSSNSQGKQAGMRQLQDGMDGIPKGFVRDADVDKHTLIDNITFGARVTNIDFNDAQQITLTYDAGASIESATGDWLIIAIPYPSLRLITKSQSFSPRKEVAIRSVRYVEVTKILLQYQKRWWEEIFQANGQGFDGGLVTDLPIRYTMFPKTEKSVQAMRSERGVVMAAYTFEQDATSLGAMSDVNRTRLAARNLDRIFPSANSLALLEASVAQVWPADAMAGGSAFAYFGPAEKSLFWDDMVSAEWNNTVFFAGEQVSYTHGWIQGAFEAAIAAALQLYAAATGGHE
jgi:monoamine oxidase